MVDTVQTAIYRLGLEAGQYTQAAQSVAAANEKIVASTTKVAVSEERVQQVTDQTGDSFSRLEARYDPLIRAEQRRSAALQQATRYLEEGAIDQQRYAAQIERVNSVYDQQIAKINAVNTAMGRNLTVVNGGLAGIGKYRTQIQQAGFQVGDFAVQIAGGTNALVAFTQQGSQLLQVFGGPWGAVIGAAVSILGALALGFMRSRDAAEDAKKEADAFTESLERMSRIMDELNPKLDRNRRSLEAERGNLVSIAEMNLRNAEAELNRIPQRIGTGRAGSISNPDYEIQLANVRRLRQELSILRAESGEFDDGFAKFGKDFASGMNNAATSTDHATASVKKLGAEAATTRDTVGELIDSFKYEEFRATAQAEAQLELAFERGRLSADEYREALQKLEAQQGGNSGAANDNAASIERANEEMRKLKDETEKQQAEMQKFTDTLADGFGDVAKSIAQTGFNLESLGQIGERVLNALIDQFVELAYVNPLKNLTAPPGQQAPTLDTLFAGFSGLFGGGASAGASYTSAGASIGATSSSALAGGMVGFARGGSFDVTGSGGTDSQLVAFKATPGERVTVETPAQQRVSNDNRRNTSITINVPPAPNGMGYSAQQIAARSVEKLAMQGRNV